MKKNRMTVVLAGLLLVLFTAPGFAMGPKAKTATWNVPGDYLTIQDAMDSPMVKDGDTILVGPGTHAGALVSKAVEIRGIGGAVIYTGPLHGSGLLMGFRFLAGSDNAVLSQLTFDGVDLAVMNGGAVDFVTVDHCTFVNCVQAISNWCGSYWQITHNIITDLRSRNGGGIGILVADYSGGIVESNYIAHNKISGTLHVDPADGGGYDGSGIVLYADFRWGWAGAEAIKDNKVIKNKVAMVSDTPSVVDICAFELTDTRGDITLPVVLFNNAIGFNDFRGTEIQINVSPDNLWDENFFSRNLGQNRGKGLHPSIFFK